MGDKQAPTANESTADIMQALTKFLPGYMEVANAQLLPQATAQLEAAQSISPAYQQLITDLYSQFAPQMAKAGAEVERINRTGAADTDLAILRGSGGELAKEGQRIDRILNPEYYASREAASAKLAELLGAIDIDAPNIEAERLVNQENVRSGNISGPSNATNTVSNALSFGNERMKRVNALGQAIGVATNLIPATVGQFNPINTALNRNSTNAGSNQFTGVTNPGNQSYDAASGMFNNITQLKMQQNDINANRRDILDRMNETTSSLPSVS